MAYEILVTATTFAVTNSSTQLAVTVTATATPTFTITNAVSNFTITNQITTATIYTDAVELVLADLNNFWKGEWTTGTYYRGDIVQYQYSQYFLDDWNADLNVGYTSTVVPPSDATWIRFNWHEAPFSVLTVTNSASIGNDLTVTDDATIGGDLAVSGDLTVGGGAGGNGLTINSTATFNGAVRINNTLTVAQTATFNSDVVMANTELEVSGLILNGVNTVRTKTTSSTLRLGIANNTAFSNSPANDYYLNTGTIIRYADKLVSTRVGGTIGEDSKVEISQNNVYLQKQQSASGPVYNYVTVNTTTAKLAAKIFSDAANQNPFGFVDGFKVSINGQTDSGSAIVGAVATGTNVVGSLTNYVRAATDAITLGSFWENQGPSDTRVWGYTRIDQNQDGITLAGQKPYGDKTGWRTPQPNYDFTTDQINDVQLKIRSNFTNQYWQNSNTPGRTVGMIESDSMGHTHFLRNPKNIPGDAYFNIFPVKGGELGTDVTYGHFYVSRPESWNLAYTAGNPQPDTQWTAATNPTFHVMVQSSTETGVVPTLGDYIEMYGNNVYVRPSEKVQFNTPYVEFEGSTQLRFGTGGIRFGSTTTIQTVAFSGYDQGTL